MSERGDVEPSPYTELVRRCDSARPTTLLTSFIVSASLIGAASQQLTDWWPALAAGLGLGALALRGLLGRAPSAEHRRSFVFVRGACVGVAATGALVAAMGMFFSLLGSRWIL